MQKWHVANVECCFLLFYSYFGRRIDRKKEKMTQQKHNKTLKNAGI